MLVAALSGVMAALNGLSFEQDHPIWAAVIKAQRVLKATEEFKNSELTFSSL